MAGYEGYSKWEVLHYEMVLGWLQSNESWVILIKGLMKNGAADQQDVETTSLDPEIQVDFEPFVGRTSARFLWEDIGRVIAELSLGHDNQITRWGFTNIMMKYITERIDK